MTTDQLDADLDRLRAAHLEINDPDPDQVAHARRRVLAVASPDAGRPFANGAPSRRRTRRVIGLAAGGLLIAGSAVAATTPWSPRLGGTHGDPATRSTQPLPRDFSDRLQILRRPQSANDRSPSVQHALKLLDREVAGGVYVDGIRRLGDGSRSTVVLVPMRRYGPRNRRGAAVQRDGLCVYAAVNATAGPAPTGGASCGTVAELERRGIGSLTARLVPDGVDRVRVVLRSGKTLTAKVTANYYELPLTIPEVAVPADGKITRAYRTAQRRQLKAMREVIGRPKLWLDARGKTIRKTY